MGRTTARRLCALAILGVVVVAPLPVLAATCNVPRPVVAVLAGLVGSGSGGLCVAASPVGALLGFVVLSVWVYLLLVAALRALAVLGTRARTPGSARVLIVTNHFVGSGWVRRLVDVAIGIGMVAASGSGQLSLPPGTSSPSIATPGGLVREVGLAEQVGELLGLDDPGVRTADPREHEKRLYTVRPGDTLALIAERELGDADLGAFLQPIWSASRRPRRRRERGRPPLSHPHRRPLSRRRPRHNGPSTRWCPSSCRRGRSWRSRCGWRCPRPCWSPCCAGASRVCHRLRSLGSAATSQRRQASPSSSRPAHEQRHNPQIPRRQTAAALKRPTFRLRSSCRCRRWRT